MRGVRLRLYIQSDAVCAVHRLKATSLWVIGLAVIAFGGHKMTKPMTLEELKDREWGKILRDALSSKDRYCQARVEGIIKRAKEIVYSGSIPFRNVQSDEWI